MSDRNLTKSKSFSIRAIMNSPLSKILFEAINSPAGSTKKTKAKSILKSFQQSHQNYLANKMMRNYQDGQGGPGAVGLDMSGNLPMSGSSFLSRYAPKYTGQPFTLSSTGTVNPTVSSLPAPAITARPTTSLTLPSTPTLPTPLSPSTVTTPFGTLTSTLASQPPTIGPTGSLVPAIPGITPTPAPKTPFALPATPTMPSGLIFYRDTKLGSKDIYNATTGAKISATDWTKNWSGKAKEVPAPAKVGQSVVSAIPTQDQSISGWDKETADLIYNKYINAGYTDAQAREELKKRTSFTPTAPTINPAKLTEDNAYDILNNLANSSGTSELDAWYKSLSPADQKRLKVPYESVKAGEGPESFSMRILSNKNLLGTVLGLPKEVIDKFPDSGLLSDQLNTLQDTVNKQFHLDEQLKNLTNMQNSGLTVKSDMQAYIRGKDEYLGKLDKMLDDFNYKTAYMDTSDPNVAKRMDNYRNYLTILQGRQNMRYIDYLNTAIESENAKMTQATNLYNLSLTKAEKEFTRAERVTTESYNLIKGSLEDMYKNIENRTKMARDTESYQLEQMKTYYQLMEQMKKVEEIGKDTYNAVKAELEASRGDDFGSAINPNNIPKQGYVNTEKYKELRDKAKDKTGFDKSFGYLLNPNDPTARSLIKQEGTTPAWMVDAGIWQWLALDETKKLSDEEKAQYIKEAGRNPENFGLYGY